MIRADAEEARAQIENGSTQQRYAVTIRKTAAGLQNHEEGNTELT